MRACMWTTAAMLLLRAATALADPLCSAQVGPCVTPPYVLIVTAFPAETAPVLARTDLVETVTAGEHTFYVGRLAGVPVVVVRGGIGLQFAAATTRAAIARFDLAAIVFSGVAGSRHRIADVVIPTEWTDGAGVFAVDARLVVAARAVRVPPVELERCTPVPPHPPGPEVCLDRAPRLIVGGRGESADPFGGNPLPCTPDGHPVFGCDEAIATNAVRPAGEPIHSDAVDMETGAVARVADEAGIPFIGVRGISDGAGDPLELGPFPNQFFAYYAVAAENAAAVVEALVDVAFDDDVPAVSATSGVNAACDWARAAAAGCAGVQAPAGVTRRIANACRLEQSVTDDAAAARMRKTWKRAARTIARARKLPRACRTPLVAVLKARGAS